MRADGSTLSEVAVLETNVPYQPLASAVST